jgi:hypothetical protein
MAKGLSKSERASLRRAFVKVASEQPWLLKEAFERGLRSSRPLGYLELGARLLKEIGAQDGAAPKIAIVFNSSLQAGKLREGAETPKMITATPVRALPSASPAEEVLDLGALLENVQDA